MQTLRRLSSSSRAKAKFSTLPDAHGGSNLQAAGAAPFQRMSETQQDQDKEDEDKRREAMRDLVESWMDRLQLISVITTFFASTEASLLSITAPSSGKPMSITSQVANIGFTGALVVHSSAAIISFLAAFVLIRYKLKMAKREEQGAEVQIAQKHSPPPSRSDTMQFADLERAKTPSSEMHEKDPIPGSLQIKVADNPVWSANPHLVQVGPFEGRPPTHLLARCHSFCVFLSALGFALALMGIVCFAWAQLPPSVGISTSFLMVMCAMAGVAIIFMPDRHMSSRIYYTGDS